MYGNSVKLIALYLPRAEKKKFTQIFKIYLLNYKTLLHSFHCQMFVFLSPKHLSSLLISTYATHSMTGLIRLVFLSRVYGLIVRLIDQCCCQDHKYAIL
jgi:hypothetical protein